MSPVSICVFCGSSPGRRPEHGEAAVGFGRALAARGHTLVYGGARVGLMGQLAQAVLDGGGPVIGVMPRMLVEREKALHELGDLRVVESLAERKALMVELADAFVALPGGLGTLDELFEVLVQAQLGGPDKPCGLLNTLGYYDPVLAWVSRAVQDGFVPAAHGRLLRVASRPEDLLDAVTGVDRG